MVWTPHGLDKQVYREGQYTVGFLDRPTIYDSRSQERDEQLEVLAANGLQIQLVASVRYHIVPGEVVDLDHDLGMHYYSILIGPTLRSQARRVVGRYQPEEIYSTQRDAIEREIREGVEKVIQGRHIELEAILVRNVTLPGVIQQAINNKLEAEQSSLKMKFIIEKTRQEAEQDMIKSKALSARAALEAEASSQRELASAKVQVERATLEAKASNERGLDGARADAQETLLRAKAAAEAKRIDGEATAQYHRSISAHLTQPVLDLERIKAMDHLAQSENAKIIISGNGKEIPLVDLK